MNLRMRAAVTTVASVLALVAGTATSAHAAVLSALPTSCGPQFESQVFAPWGDQSLYTPVSGGSFEPGDAAWSLSGGAAPAPGNESFDVAGPGASSLALPAGSVAVSPFQCTNIYHPTLRLFVRNTGAPSSHLIVQAIYPGLLGNLQTATIGQISGSATWAPSPVMSLLVTNVFGTLSVSETAIAFRFTPADASGHWSIDDVYLDPYSRG